MAERAILEIIAEADAALREFDRLEKDFIETTEKMNRALDEGIESEDAAKDLEKLERRAEEVGNEMVDAGKKATRALKEISKSGRVAGESQEQLQQEIKQTEARLVRARAAAKRFGDQSAKAAARARKAFASVGKGLASLRGAFLAVGGTLVLNEITKATERQAQAESILEGLVRQTGMAAGFTADELKKMASGLQEVTLFGDEAVIEAQNILLTFREIGRDVFPEVVERAADLATLMAQGKGGQVSIKDAAIQLGKALNDPVKNLSALSRAGIQFNEEQTETIKGLVESNKLFEAQTIILKELDAQFGGVAKNARVRLGGAFAALRVRVGDLLEVMGGPGGLLATFDNFSEQALESAKAGSRAEKSLADLGKVLSALVIAMVAVVKSFAILRTTALAVGGTFAKIRSGFDGMRASMLEWLAEATKNKIIAKEFRETAEEIRGTADDFGEASKQLFLDAGDAIRASQQGLKEDFEFLTSIFDGTAQSAAEAALKQKRLGDTAEEVTQQMDPLRNLLGPVADGEEELGDKAEVAAGQVMMLTDAAKALVGLMENQQSAVANAGQEVENLEQAISDLEEKQRIEGVLSPEELEKLFQAQDALADANFTLSESQTKLAETEARVAQETQNATMAQQEAQMATVALSNDLSLAGEAAAIVAEKFQADLVPVISEVETKIEELDDGTQKITNTYEEQALALEKNAEGVFVLTNATEEQTEALENLNETVAERIKREKETQEQLEASRKETERNIVATGELGGSLEALQRAADMGIDGAVEALARLTSAIQSADAAAQSLHASLETIDEGVI